MQSNRKEVIKNLAIIRSSYFLKGLTTEAVLAFFFKAPIGVTTYCGQAFPLPSPPLSLYAEKKLRFSLEIPLPLKEWKWDWFGGCFLSQFTVQLVSKDGHTYFRKDFLTALSYICYMP